MIHRLFLSGMLALTFLFLPGPSALAASTWYVNGVTGSDTNTCASSAVSCKTIGHAIALASSGNTIKVAAATYPENLTIPISLTIGGAGASTTIVDGGLRGTVVTIPNSTSTVTIVGVTIQNGSAVNGGGIYNGGGTLTLRNVTVSSNQASFYGGGISNGSGMLTMTSSTLSGNSANAFGGGYGGGISNGGGTLTLRNVTVSGNHAGSLGGGIYTSGGTLAMTSSTVSGNSINVGSSFPIPEGGGIYNSGGTLTITSSTVSDNNMLGSPTSAFGGGISNNGGTLTMTSSTVSGNGLADQESSAILEGGGIYNVGVLTIASSTLSNNSAFGFTESLGSEIYGVATLQNTIVANNGNANNSSSGNCQGGITSRGYNLSSDSTCGLSGPGDLNNTDPQLGPLQNNGGPTQTRALLTGSPAIDAGNPAGCTGPTGKLLTIDQRGQPRPDPEDAGVGCDIGAYESQTD